MIGPSIQAICQLEHLASQGSFNNCSLRVLASSATISLWKTCTKMVGNRIEWVRPGGQVASNSVELDQALPLADYNPFNGTITVLLRSAHSANLGRILPHVYICLLYICPCLQGWISYKHVMCRWRSCRWQKYTLLAYCSIFQACLNTENLQEPVYFGLSASYPHIGYVLNILSRTRQPGRAGDWSLWSMEYSIRLLATLDLHMFRYESNVPSRSRLPGRAGTHLYGLWNILSVCLQHLTCTCYIFAASKGQQSMASWFADQPVTEHVTCSYW